MERNWYNIDCVTFTRTRSSDVTYDSVWNQCGAIMPNWCSNNIVIEGPKEKVEAIWSRAIDDTDEGLLTALHPIGKWEYETALAEWGTKWDINMTKEKMRSREVYFHSKKRAKGESER